MSCRVMAARIGTVPARTLTININIGILLRTLTIRPTAQWQHALFGAVGAMKEKSPVPDGMQTLVVSF